ncbi:unnamed protein product, partial [Owenia fusiformis]
MQTQKSLNRQKSMPSVIVTHVPTSQKMACQHHLFDQYDGRYPSQSHAVRVQQQLLRPRSSSLEPHGYSEPPPESNPSLYNTIHSFHPGPNLAVNHYLTLNRVRTNSHSDSDTGYNPYSTIHELKNLDSVVDQNFNRRSRYDSLDYETDTSGSTYSPYSTISSIPEWRFPDANGEYPIMHHFPAESNSSDPGDELKSATLAK